MSWGRAGRAGAVALAAAGVAVGGCGADVEPGATTADRGATAPAKTLATTPQGGGAKPRPVGPPGYVEPLAFHVLRTTQLRLKPNGKMVRALTPHTGFHSPRILAVAKRKPGWVLVRTSVSGHPVGWLPESAGKIFSEPRSIVIDLSKRRLSVFHRGRLSGVYRVAVGAPGTTTPTGKFGVTDRLRVKPGTPYGCCILALTAHQPNIAQGWGGGDRVAIHATPFRWTIGKAISHGCVRASNRALHQLMRRIRLGTPVTIHA